MIEYFTANKYYIVKPDEKEEKNLGVILPDDDEKDELSTGVIFAESIDDPFFVEGKRVAYSKKHRDFPVESITLENVKYDVVHLEALRIAMWEKK